MRRALAAWTLAGLGAAAGASPLPMTEAPASTWRTAWDATAYFSAEAARLPAHAVLDPGNHLARLPEQALGAEARLNLKLESEALRLALRPILSWRREDGEAAPRGYLSQWQVRAAVSDTLAVSVGRELMNWGPAQFRSPSSPFYFDNGRSNPARELSGVDAAKLSWTPDAGRVLSLAWVRDSGHEAGPDDPWRHTWLARGEWRGDDRAGGLVLAKAAGRPAFLGGWGQWTVDEAWLVYAEAASSSRAGALVSPADPGQAFTVEPESGRRAAALVGATHTFENGQGLSLEYLYDGHGYDHGGIAAYFARAAADPAAAGLALARMPPLLGRHYLHLVWQGNPLEDATYWRLMWSRSLDDGGNALAAWLDQPLGGRLSLYALAQVNTGGPRREAGALIERGLTVGLRLALP